MVGVLSFFFWLLLLMSLQAAAAAIATFLASSWLFSAVCCGDILCVSINNNLKLPVFEIKRCLELS